MPALTPWQQWIASLQHPPGPEDEPITIEDGPYEGTYAEIMAGRKARGK